MFPRLDEMLPGSDKMLHCLNEMLHRLDEMLHRLDEMLHGLDEVLPGLDEMLHRLDEMYCRSGGRFLRLPGKERVRKRGGRAALFRASRRGCGARGGAVAPGGSGADAGGSVCFRKRRGAAPNESFGRSPSADRGSLLLFRTDQKMNFTPRSIPQVLPVERALVHCVFLLKSSRLEALST